MAEKVASSVKVAIYVRVSTTDQMPENQLIALRNLAHRDGHEIVQEFIDHGVSGVSAKKGAREQMLLQAKANRFTVLYCTSIDRLSRSTKDLIQVVEELNSLGITLIFQRENIDTKSAIGQFFLTVLGSLAQFEREIMIERINAGIARAKSAGKKMGRPSKVNDGLKNAVTMLHEKGVSIRNIAQTCSIGIGTIYKILSEKQGTASASA